VEQLRALMRAAEGSMWEMPIVLAATTGARRSEILALHWSDVDLDTGRLRIVRSLHRTRDGLVALEPKTDRARRTITLPSIAIERLRRHHAEQAERRLRLGAAWKDEDLVCDHGDGSAVDPDSFTGAFKRIARQAGLSEQTRLHDVRHAVATALLE